MGVGRSQGLPKFFRASIYRPHDPHRAVFFAIARLSYMGLASIKLPVVYNQQLGRRPTGIQTIHIYTYECEKWLHSESTNPIDLDLDRCVRSLV